MRSNKIIMMPKRKTKILAAFSFILALAALGAFFFLFSFMKGKVAEAVNEENEIKVQIEKEDSLSSMQRSIEDNQADENEIAGYVIPSNSVADFIQTLDTLVATSGLESEVDSVNYVPSAALTPENAEDVDVKISVEGAWSNVMFFLQLLEHYPLKISIESVSLKQYAEYTVKGKEIPQWSADIDFTAVKFKDN